MKKIQTRESDAVWYDTHYYNKPTKKRIQWYDMLLFDVLRHIEKSNRILDFILVPFSGAGGGIEVAMGVSDPLCHRRRVRS